MGGSGQLAFCETCIVGVAKLGLQVPTSGQRSSCGATHIPPIRHCSEFIARPLWRNAEKLPQAAEVGAGSWWLAGLRQEQRRTALAVALGATAVAVGVLLWRHRRTAAAALH